MRKKMYFGAVIVVSLVALSVSGCKARNGPTVIAEQAVGEKPGQSAGDGSRQYVGEGVVQGEGRGNSTNISGMLQAPERYQTSIAAEHMTLTADVLVEFPDVSGIKVKKTILKPYTLDEYNQLKDFLGKRQGIDWQEAGKETSAFDETTESETINAMNVGVMDSVPYMMQYFAVKTDEQGNVPGSIFTNYMGMWAGQNYYVPAEMEDFAENFQEELKAGKQLGQLGIIADEIMEELGCGDMELQLASWGLGNTGAKAEKIALWHPMARFSYTKEVDQVPLLYGKPAPIIERNPDRGEVIQIVLDRDGNLACLYFCNRQDTAAAGKEDEFFLPFSEISQIFEQVMKGSYRDYNTLQSFGEADIAFTVKSVKLGYKAVFERKGGIVKTEGKLLPVWNFYGTVSVLGEGGGEISAARKFHAPETVLLTINAMDGTVVEN